MCHILRTLLACGHSARGPLLQCQEAVQATPRGPPYDDGRMVLCDRSEELLVWQNVCCEACFIVVIGGAIQASCHPCRGGITQHFSSAAWTCSFGKRRYGSILGLIEWTGVPSSRSKGSSSARGHEYCSFRVSAILWYWAKAGTIVHTTLLTKQTVLGVVLALADLGPSHVKVAKGGEILEYETPHLKTALELESLRQGGFFRGQGA